jgi:hypothetical protein
MYYHNTANAPATTPHVSASIPPALVRVMRQLSPAFVGPPTVCVPMSADQALNPSTVPATGELGGDGVLYVGVNMSWRIVVCPFASTVVYVYSVTPWPTGTVGAGCATGPCATGGGVVVGTTLCD